MEPREAYNFRPNAFLVLPKPLPTDNRRLIAARADTVTAFSFETTVDAMRAMSYSTSQLGDGGRSLGVSIYKTIILFLQLVLFLLL